MSLLPRFGRLSCHIQDIGLATFKTSVLPCSRCLYCHVSDVSLATFKTSILPCSRRRNNDEIYIVGKETSCETAFVGVRCLSFSRQYKVAIASNAPSEFDPNVLVAHTQLVFHGRHSLRHLALLCTGKFCFLLRGLGLEGDLALGQCGGL